MLFFMCYAQEATLAIDLSTGQSEWYCDHDKFSVYFSTDAVQWIERRNVILKNARLKLAKS